MNISLKWLNAHLDQPVNAAEAERVLTDVGFPFDSAVEPVGDGDFLCDVEVTSNRPDCLSHLGVAREIAAATGRRLVEPAIETPESSGAAPVEKLTSVANEAVDLCPLYTARGITGVKVGPSPKWIVERLEAIGQPSVNNVVDITNYVLHELGQPLHAFDMANLDGRRIVVRRAAQGEPFTAIDGTKHTLTTDMLVIADASRPQAVAGVMGGLDSEISDATTDVLLESARFDPLNVRSTSRALKLASDSSYRFERGVDPYGVDRASQRAAQLIVELCGGELAPGVIAEGAPLPPHHLVTLRPEHCNRLLGLDLPVELMLQLLNGLGLQAEFDEAINCTIPSHRLDLRREVDLIEEIARLHGFAHIPVEPKMHIEALRPQANVAARQAIGRTLVAHGYCEAITFSFIAADQAEPFHEGADLLRVDEEKKKAEPALRPSLLPSLLACRKSNQDAGNGDVRLFEVGQVFAGRAGATSESRRLALLADAPDPAAGQRAMRGTIEELLEVLGLSGAVAIEQAEPTDWAQPLAKIVAAADKKVIGRFGPATAALRKRFDLQAPVVAAELDYAALVGDFPPQPQVHSLPRFPAIERDLSVIVAEAVTWAELRGVVDAVDPPLLEAVEFVTVYRGKPIIKGSKSVTLRMRFRDPARTLQHDEVSAAVDRVVEAMRKKLQAELRD